jgi:hypothetical protein
MAGTPRTTKKRANTGEGEQSSSKRNKRADPAMTLEEVLNFVPKPVVDYVRESKVSRSAL